ncbi:MAG: sigma-70 family RNA polymerase sigma factor [Kiritimatiellae bacterium]|nr:sigma-70 family RNA polymerase sigma factor [Kiritimatiellia bacterium]
MAGEEQGLSGEQLQRAFIGQRDRLFAYILAAIRDFADAEDLFQDVSLVILKKQQDGIVVRHFGAWSREIARRTVQDYFKRRKKDRLVLAGDALELLEQAFAAHDAENGGEDQLLLRRLRRCVSELPGHLHDLVALRYRESLPLREIAARLGRSAGAVQVALSRTRTKLLDCTRRLRFQEETV